MTREYTIAIVVRPNGLAGKAEVTNYKVVARTLAEARRKAKALHKTAGDSHPL